MGLISSGKADHPLGYWSDDIYIIVKDGYIDDLPELVIAVGSLEDAKRRISQLINETYQRVDGDHLFIQEYADKPDPFSGSIYTVWYKYPALKKGLSLAPSGGFYITGSTVEKMETGRYHFHIVPCRVPSGWKMVNVGEQLT